jgi:UDP-N-acetylglucosamine/UDP-N-acetylgalactosamine diphosphorylase
MQALKDKVNDLMHPHSSHSTSTAPPEPSKEQYEELKTKYEEASQGHVFNFWKDLSSAEKGTLFVQLRDVIDPARANELFKQVNSEATQPASTDIEPIPASVISSTLDSKPEDLKNWYNLGLELTSQNKVGVVLMAGGQGTRLGSTDPKGCFNIGLPSKKSLFQLQAERIAKVENLAAATSGELAPVIPWYVMTSGPTRGPTEAFFQKNNYFGLKKENVFIFEQGVLPCISNDGKIIMESKGKVAVAPDGNGGLYQALLISGAVADMKKRGVQHLHAYCVDNCLVRVADPTFIGFSASKNVDVATKVVRKRNAGEKVGMIVKKDGHPDVIEYSEISKELASEPDPAHPDLLKYRTANIVNHYYSFSFLDSIPDWSRRLPHHIARKAIPHVDTTTGETVKPTSPNGIKLEQFVFDCFAFLSMDKFACQEVKREDEFSPLKNKIGNNEDDADTSRRDILQQGRKWIEAAGGVIEDEGGDDPEAGVEISPLISYVSFLVLYFPFVKLNVSRLVKDSHLFRDKATRPLSFWKSHNRDDKFTKIKRYYAYKSLFICRYSVDQNTLQLEFIHYHHTTSLQASPKVIGIEISTKLWINIHYSYISLVSISHNRLAVHTRLRIRFNINPQHAIHLELKHRLITTLALHLLLANGRTILQIGLDVFQRAPRREYVLFGALALNLQLVRLLCDAELVRVEPQHLRGVCGRAVALQRHVVRVLQRRQLAVQRRQVRLVLREHAGAH